jgi:Rrf2 family transcriptional regulator, iron-sulfur cluster assembly transcription factor
MFSKASEYAIKAVIFIASRPANSKRAGLGEIANAINSPEAYTAKILQQLRRNHIIRSVKGPNGGFEIGAAQLNKLKLSHIVHAFDGDSIYTGCGLGLEACNEDHPCPVHDKFKKIREELRYMLETTSVIELAESIHQGKVFLKM